MHDAHNFFCCCCCYCCVVAENLPSGSEVLIILICSVRTALLQYVRARDQGSDLMAGSLIVLGELQGLLAKSQCLASAFCCRTSPLVSPTTFPAGHAFHDDPFSNLVFCNVDGDLTTTTTTKQHIICTRYQVLYRQIRQRNRRTYITQAHYVWCGSTSHWWWCDLLTGCGRILVIDALCDTVLWSTGQRKGAYTLLPHL